MYDEVMKWHKEATGDPFDDDAYLSRKKMIKKLAKRYNFPDKLVMEKEVILPSSGAKVNIVYHDAHDQLVSLLTDPRFGDEDWLHFDDDPLAPLLDELKYLEDINTGLSYQETHKQLITKGRCSLGTW